MENPGSSKKLPGTIHKTSSHPMSITGSASADDPYIYASMLSTFLGNNGPFANMVAELSRMAHLMTDTRKVTQAHIARLEAQTAKVQNQISASQVKTSGIHLDKLR
jgi:hypothetical protein